MNKLFEGSHFHLIRTNSEYRMMCQMEDMRLAQEPAWYREPLEEPIELEGRIIALEAKVKSIQDLKYITPYKKKDTYTIIE